MNRRHFIMVAAGAVGLSPVASWAQPAQMPVIGVLDQRSPDELRERLRGLRLGLRDAGFIEGENVAIEYRWAENKEERLPGLAAELVHRPVKAIVATSGLKPALAAKAATTSIPIIFVISDDPVRLGLVASLNRPGGNLTGINFFNGELTAKRLGFLRDMVPAATRLAVLVNPHGAEHTEATLREVKPAARAMGLELQVVETATIAEINAAFSTFAREAPDALFVGNDPFFNGRRTQLVHLATRYAIPASYSARDFTEAGGLMSYGANVADAWRQGGSYAGRILKGAKPADLPVMQSNKFELVINAQTALILGLTVPTQLLAGADEVIE